MDSTKKDLITAIEKKFSVLKQVLDEDAKRIWAATEALSVPGGGSLVSKATGISRITIRKGIAEIKSAYENQEKLDYNRNRIRGAGGGRKKITQNNPQILQDLKELLEDNTRGDPMSSLKWTSKSTVYLAEALTQKGHTISDETVRLVLHENGYSLQGNKKTIEGKSHPDRDAQFRYINDLSKEFQDAKQPVISVDTKKKENIGLFKNNGQEWRPKGDPRKVRGHDFVDKKLGKAIPYGIYDIANNEGFVSVGVDHDTAEFAVQTVRNWWNQMGKEAYPKATKLMLTADCGGSNRAISHLWKIELQKLSNDLKLEIHISHFPPGTSKWNKIEHRMFSHISSNWRGQPLISREVVVSLIGATKTKAGLRIKAMLDKNNYAIGKKVDKKELKEINLIGKEFHGEWNYVVSPKKEVRAIQAAH